jgi:hypothetical protein
LGFVWVLVSVFLFVFDRQWQKSYSTSHPSHSVHCDLALTSADLNMKDKTRDGAGADRKLTVHIGSPTPRVIIGTVDTAVV